MSNEPDRPASLLSSVTRVIENLACNEDNYDNLVIILSLLCLLTILNRNQRPNVSSTVHSTPAGTGNTLQKLVGDLAKGDGAPSAETLMSLLPLLNSPQVKSKLNPSTMATVLGLLNNFGGNSGGTNDKQEINKQEKMERKERGDLRSENRKDGVSPLISGTSQSKSSGLTEESYNADSGTDDGDNDDKKGIGRYLNWKNNF